MRSLMLDRDSQGSSRCQGSELNPRRTQTVSPSVRCGAHTKMQQNSGYLFRETNGVALIPLSIDLCAAA